MALEKHVSEGAEFEIGKLEDWNTMSMVEVVGTLSTDAGRKFEVVRSFAGLHFELWDKETGFKARVNVTNVLNSAATALLERCTRPE